jgi:hypothetical protein
MPDATAIPAAVPFDADVTKVVRPAMHHVNSSARMMTTDHASRD